MTGENWKRNRRSPSTSLRAGSPLRSPGFPVEVRDVGELHAAFPTESRTVVEGGRKSGCASVGMTNLRAALPLKIRSLVVGTEASADFHHLGWGAGPSILPQQMPCSQTFPMGRCGVGRITYLTRDRSSHNISHPSFPELIHPKTKARPPCLSA